MAVMARFTLFAFNNAPQRPLVSPIHDCAEIEPQAIELPGKHATFLSHTGSTLKQAGSATGDASRNRMGSADAIS
jgi:hypothetical protein